MKRIFFIAVIIFFITTIPAYATYIIYCKDGKEFFVLNYQITEKDVTYITNYGIYHLPLDKVNIEKTEYERDMKDRKTEYEQDMKDHGPKWQEMQRKEEEKRKEAEDLKRRISEYQMRKEIEEKEQKNKIEGLVKTNKEGTDWKLLYTGDIGSVYYDAGSISSSSEGILVWTRFDPSEQTKKNMDIFTLAMAGKRVFGPNYGYEMSLNEINCVNKTCCLMYRADYSRTGEIISEGRPEQPKARSINSNDNESKHTFLLYKIVCQ